MTLSLIGALGLMALGLLVTALLAHCEDRLAMHDIDYRDLMQ